jgi:hypothetical protein
MTNTTRILLASILALQLSACAAPDESTAAKVPQNAGFLTDYALLVSPDWEGAVTGFYIDPQLAQTVERYSGVMVDQPEVFISVDSPYRGVKPDGIKMVADLMRFLLIGDMLRGGYNVVEEPGNDIVYLRVALTGLELEKVSGASGYVPMAEDKQGEAERVRAFMSTLNIVDVTVEIELVDSVTNQVIIAAIAHGDLATDQADAPSGWSGLGRLLESLTVGMSCLVNKANIPADARIDICRGVT